MKINRHILEVNEMKVQALSFIPDVKKPLRAVFTHGYTSSKNSILSWAQRLSSEGISCIILDQPGHFLGSFEQINSFDDFTQDFYKFFEQADLTLTNLLNEKTDRVILGGHSLGALSALKAIEDDHFKEMDSTAILAGFGLLEEGSSHIFQSKLYQDTLKVRAELVSEHIPPDKVFPWISSQKEELKLSGHKIYLINGLDDMVVGANGSTQIVNLLTELGNEVILKQPKKMPHHEPGLASPHIMAIVKEEFKTYFL